MRILIVDDEGPARARLRLLLAELDGDYEVAGEAADGEAALAVCRERDVDLVLLDISMPGMDGLALAARLARLQPPPAVIMVTAYGQYALDAFERRVDDYLVKPVRRERLRAALERVRVPTRAQREALFDTGAGPPRRRRHITAHYRSGLKTVRVEDVLYLQAEQKYVTVRFADGSLLVDESLKTLEEEFPDLFLRIHRNALVARRAIAGLEKAADGTSHIHLRGCEDCLSVSRRHLAEVRRWLRAGTTE